MPEHHHHHIGCFRFRIRNVARMMMIRIRKTSARVAQLMTGTSGYKNEYEDGRYHDDEENNDDDDDDNKTHLSKGGTAGDWRQ